MAKATKDAEKNMSELFTELEEIIDWFSGDGADIDESLKKFERGVELSDQLKKHLSEVENKVEKIKQKFD